MKLSQARLREIIQEEVARMNEDEERSFRKELINALRASNLKPTERDINMVLDVYEDSWVDAGNDRELQDRAVADTVAALELPPFNLKPEPKGELEEVDVMSGRIPPEVPEKPEVPEVPEDVKAFLKDTEDTGARIDTRDKFITVINSLVNSLSPKVPMKRKIIDLRALVKAIEDKEQ